ncbi:hypothetical protein KsCSTR_07180 [Candidatus Kuenenia stuttgartiensis]|uniref:Uncharacterized protein n=1 Tax=Kuenenia stuttgartiensis TaxID=174633 RepID=Q1PZL2_KUEST|nr:hypothetical protein KsCSTR_07180 [Candidatus Kuenenia stuttgartiensis]CAJ72525.1 unknown protein [Candidatus Kuenenia stuttgartiensis]
MPSNPEENGYTVSLRERGNNAWPCPYLSEQICLSGRLFIGFCVALQDLAPYQ